MQRWMMGLLMGTVVLNTAGMAVAEPQGPQTADKALSALLQDANRGAYADSFDLLTVRSQDCLVNVYSHTTGAPADDVRSWLREPGPAAEWMWQEVMHVSGLPSAGLVSLGQVKSDQATVWIQQGAARRAVIVNQSNGWHVALMESVLPSWLDVAAAAPTAIPDPDQVSVVEEREGTNDPLSDPLPANWPSDSAPCGPFYVNPGTRVY